MLLPPSYEELMPGNHPVRVVYEVMERIASQLRELWAYTGYTGKGNRIRKHKTAKDSEDSSQADLKR